MYTCSHNLQVHQLYEKPGLYVLPCHYMFIQPSCTFCFYVAIHFSGLFDYLTFFDSSDCTKGT